MQTPAPLSSNCLSHCNREYEILRENRGTDLLLKNYSWPQRRRRKKTNAKGLRPLERFWDRLVLGDAILSQLVFAAKNFPLIAHVKVLLVVVGSSSILDSLISLDPLPASACPTKPPPRDTAFATPASSYPIAICLAAEFSCRSRPIQSKRQGLRYGTRRIFLFTSESNHHTGTVSRRTTTLPAKRPSTWTISTSTSSTSSV